MKNAKKYILALMLCLIAAPLLAQDGAEAMQEAERLQYFLNSGKVVFWVLLIIITGLFAFMFITERRLSKLEKEVNG